MNVFIVINVFKVSLFLVMDKGLLCLWKIYGEL